MDMTSSGGKMDPRAEFFDQHASRWEETCYPDEVRARLAPLVEKFRLRRGACILEMGTGTGILHPYLVDALGENGYVAAFDLSFQMLKEAMRKPHRQNLSCVQATAMELPFQQCHFDQIVCFAAFPHFADKQRALHEMARVVKHGGKVVVAHLLSREELLAHHKTHPAVADDRLPDTETMRQLFNTAGFTYPDITNEPGLYLARAVKRYCIT
jgi:ubiquinone/menaquinone biosynthesis C-methylase UbiE